MKKLDKLLLSSFLPPFVVTFFIALFVLIMQTLWVYIDDIIGKGAGFWMILEFVFYRSISLFPMALPIAILLSSVMIMGNLAENYELSSMKSAGVSLLRVIRPLFYASIVIAFFSWISSNYLIPVANLKFKSRLYDMRKQKPTLNLEEGIFNDDFEGYRIRIGEKEKNGAGIKNVFIANHATGQKDNLNELISEDGKMYVIEDGRYLFMELNHGEQFQEGSRYVSGSPSKAPFVRTSFRKYTKIFDMDEFEINRTDEELFKNHYTMLSMRQLRVAIDSIDVKIGERKKELSQYVDNYFIGFDNIKDTKVVIDTVGKALMELRVMTDTKPSDTIATIVAKPTLKQAPMASQLTPPKAVAIQANKFKKTAKEESPKVFKLPPKQNTNNQEITKDLKEYTSLIETFPNYKKQPILDKALQISRNIKINADSAISFMDKAKENRVKHIFELYSKYAFAVVCIVFLFVGAPMGAIVQKGGFGYPLLIAIICFMLYIVLTMVFKDLAEAFVIGPILAVWMPNLILLPIGMFLTYKALNDSKVLGTGPITVFFKKLIAKFN